ncbi:MAG: hypothetical protein ACKOPT_00860 [Cyanobium sp.]
MLKPFIAVMTQSPSPSSGGEPSATPGTFPRETDEGLRQLLENLQQDRIWLLRQLDGGRWPQWRLDLAALERELGQVLDQAAERLE